MPVSIVVGGQYGSEGKGKVAHFLAGRPEASVAIRTGGPNSGHTVVEDGRRHVFRCLPTACLIHIIQDNPKPLISLRFLLHRKVHGSQGEKGSLGRFRGAAGGPSWAP